MRRRVSAAGVREQAGFLKAGFCLPAHILSAGGCCVCSKEDGRPLRGRTCARWEEGFSLLFTTAWLLKPLPLYYLLYLPAT